MTRWDRLVRDHGPVVFTIAWHILGQAAEAEEVVEKVFLQVRQIQRRRSVAWPRRRATCWARRIT